MTDALQEALVEASITARSLGFQQILLLSCCKELVQVCSRWRIPDWKERTMMADISHLQQMGLVSKLIFVPKVVLSNVWQLAVMAKKCQLSTVSLVWIMLLANLDFFFIWYQKNWTNTALKLFAICIFTDACSQFQASLVKHQSSNHMSLRHLIKHQVNDTWRLKNQEFHRDPTQKLKQTNNSYYRNSDMEKIGRAHV